MAKRAPKDKDKEKKPLTGFDLAKDLINQYEDQIVDPDKDSSIYGAPTGLKAIDTAIGTKGLGGAPVGHITEIYGPFASGKSLIGYLMGIQTQLRGGIFILIDSEMAYNPEWGAKLGVDNKNLVRVIPESQEDCYIKMMEIIDKIRDYSKDQDVTILWDSVAAVQTQSQIDGKNMMGVSAKVHSDYLKKITPKIFHKDIALVVINQLRDNIGVMWGPKQKTTGGNAIPYYATLRLDVRMTKNIKQGDLIIGKEGFVEITKSRTCPPFTRVPIRLYFDERGMDTNAGLFTTAISKGALELALTKAGKEREGYYTVVNLEDGPVFTENTFDKHMSESPELRDAILKYIEEH